MSQPTPRTNLPEPLSGLRVQPVVELGGRPWLTLEETNRLLRQQGVAATLARAWVLDELVRSIPLDNRQEQQLIRNWIENNGIQSESELITWLGQRQLLREDLAVIATQGERLERFRRYRWGPEVEIQFLQRKAQLDQVVYSLIRLRDQSLAEEIYQRISAGEEEFASLARRFAEGRERLTHGLIGPLPMDSAHTEIAGRLRVGEAGQLWPPFSADQYWVLLRLEEKVPARLNAETRARMLRELFENWLQARVDLLLAGESLPSLPPVPAAMEDLPPP
jgi:parvulin-like peptidyl-prolyl isomerase